MNLKNDIKAFLFDVDGTLVDKDCLCSEKMLYCLKELKNRGYDLVINSGRAIFSSKKVLIKNDILDLFDYFYGCNGIEFEDVKNKIHTYVDYVYDDSIKFLNKFFCEDYLALACYHDEKELLINHMISDREMMDTWSKRRFVSFREYDFNSLEKSPKLIVVFLKEHKKELDEKIASINDSRFDMFYSGEDVMEIVPKGLSKGKSVIDFANLKNINPKAILTAGDCENDVPALINGTGVYVGNKNAKVAYSVDDVYKDGLANFLYENFLS